MIAHKMSNMKWSGEALASMRQVADAFIDEMRKNHGVNLDYSKDSYALLDSIAEKAKSFEGDYRTSIEMGMMAYLGELLLAQCRGKWYLGEENLPGVTLESCSTGQGTTILPLAWIHKRIRYGSREGIGFKLATITANKQSPASPDWPEDNEPAFKFAKSLSLHASEKDLVDEWVRKWLQIRKETAYNPDSQDSSDPNQDRMRLKSHSESMIDNAKELNIQIKKYLLGKTVKMTGRLWNFYPAPFGADTFAILPVIDTLISDGLEFSPTEFVGLLRYLEMDRLYYYDWPFKHIWKIEKAAKFFKKASVEERAEALLILLRFVETKKYHHEFVQLKRILSIPTSSDERILSHLKEFEFERKDGSCIAVEMILRRQFRGASTAYENFDRQRKTIVWLDSASGKTPKEAWRDKLRMLTEIGAKLDIEDVCLWVLRHSDYEQSILDAGSVNQVFRRFMKSARWYTQGI